MSADVAARALESASPAPRGRRDERIAVVAATAWAAALVAVHGWFALVSGAAIVVLAAGMLLSSRAHRRGSARIGSATWALVALAGVGALAVALPVGLASGDRHALSVAASGRAVTVTGVVASKVEPTDRGELRFDLDVLRATAGTLDRPLRAVVTITVDPANVEGEVLDLGSTVDARGTARPADAGRRSVLEISAVQGVEVITPPPGVLRATADLRADFVELSSRMPGDGGDLVPGLAVGDTSAVSVELDQAMKDSSLSHLTAVSGANCAIIVGLVFAAAGMLRAPRWARITSSLLALGGFVALVTPEPSVVRAAAMASIALLALALDRPGSGVAVLSFAVVVLLASDPWLATQLGFALSVAATAALLVLAPRLAGGLQRWMPRPLALALAVPLAAQLACGPLLVLIEPEIPVFGVLANIVAGPAAPLATVVGLAACLAAAVPLLGAALAWIAWLPASWIATTATAFAGLPGGKVLWWEGGIGAVVLAALGFAVVLALARPPAHPVGRTARWVSVVVVAVVGAAGLGSLALSSILAPLTVPRDWVIAQCDVGQGDAVVLRSGEEVMVIDTGPEAPSFSQCLTTLGVERVDLLVLTHFDLDHVGGAEALLGRADQILHGPTGEAADRRLLAAFERAGASIHEGRTGMTGGFGTTEWRVLWPRTASGGFAPGNDTSIVLEVRDAASGADGMPRGLYLGDLSAAAQRALLATGGVRGPYDVVKVAHHGSADQLPDLYAEADGSIALIGVGAENDFGHPRDEALALVADDVLIRSDEDGVGVVRVVDGQLRVWRASG